MDIASLSTSAGNCRIFLPWRIWRFHPAGANALFELLALNKPHLLIPLSQSASRGDQVLNARSFARQGFSAVLEEEQLTGASLLSAVQELWRNREQYRRAMSGMKLADAVTEIIGVIDAISKNKGS